MNQTIMKNKLLEKFSPSAISESVYLHTRRTTDIDELTDIELEQIYRMFFPKQPSLAEQVILAKQKEDLKWHRSVCLSIATKIGLKEPDSWDSFNRWMLNSSILKKKLNDYSVTELQSLERQLRSAESNYQNSAQKTGNKAWYHKNKFPMPSKN